MLLWTLCAPLTEPLKGSDFKLIMLLLETRRFIRHNRGLAISGICVLGIGLGASALVFTCLLALTAPVVRGMRGMSYATIAEAAQGSGSERIPWHRFEHIHASVGPGVHLAAYSQALNLNAHVSRSDMNLRLASVSRGFWGEFTPGLAAGRDFYAMEETACQPRVLILSYESAVRIFASPSSAIGQAMTVNGQGYEIIGVGPPSFIGVFNQSVDGWAPPACLLSLNSLDGVAAREDPQIWRKIAWFYAIAGERTISPAKFINKLGKGLPGAENGEAPLHVSVGLTLDPVRDERLLRWLRLAFLFTVAFTVMSGMNYAILLLARTPGQIDDIQLKKALGASPGRILIELTIGPSIMVALGTLAAWGICFGSLAALAGFFTEAKDIVSGALPYAWVACGGIAIFAVLLTGLVAFVPAVSVLRSGQGSLTSRHTATARGSSVLLLDAIVTVQIVLCMVMVVVAGMVTSSALHLLRTPLGFETTKLSIIALGPRDSNGLSVSIDTTSPDRASYPSAAAIREVLRNLGGLPGARKAGYSENVPMGEPLSSVSAQLADGTSKTYTAAESIVTQGFFDSMGIRLLKGAVFPKDESMAANQAVINRRLALELSPQGYPLGKTVRIVNPAASGLPSFSETATIIGVVDDVKQSGPASSAEPTLYQCAFGERFFHSAPYFVLSGIEAKDAPRREIERSIAILMPGLQVQDIFSLQDRVHASMVPEEERAGAVMVLAILISSLAFLGLGASLTFYVANRRRDLAVRICFGATAWKIRALVIRRAAACGGAAALLSMMSWPFLTRLSSSIYLGSVSWSYTRAIVSSFACFAFVIGLSMIPANAATRMSPSEVLKDY